VFFYLIVFILICVALFFVRKFLNKIKTPQCGAFMLVTGGIKKGKTTLAVATAINEYKSRLRKTKRKNFFGRLFKGSKYKDVELPLLYSNIPLSIPYVPITRDLILRKKRFVYNSVWYIGEASLVADSMCIKNTDVNDNISLLIKLFGHEGKGSCCIVDTQCVNDLHYGFRRNLSEYVYVHHLIKWIPFILIAKVQETRYADDGTVVTSQNDDVELHLRSVFMWKSVWKKFDTYCYSCLTDNLPVEKHVVSTRDLKAKSIVSFKDRFNKENVENEKK